MIRRNSLGHGLAAAGLLALALAANPVKADSIVYVSPTSSIVSLSDAYVVPTSYVSSTSYLVPTSYSSSTTYVVPTSTVLTTTRYVEPTTYYVPRSYIRRTARYGTVVSPTYYVAPTTYLTPTVYLSPRSYITTTGLTTRDACDPDPCCETGSVVRPSAPAPAATKATGAKPPVDEERVERRPTGQYDDDPQTTPTSANRPKSILSTPAGGASGNVGGSSGSLKNETSGAGAKSNPAATEATPPPYTPPVPSRSTPEPGGGLGGSPFDTEKPAAVKGATTPAPAATKTDATKSTPPASTPVPPPAGVKPTPAEPDPASIDLPIPPPLGPAPGDPTKRDAFRPKVNDSDVGGLRPLRNVLQGRVLSADSGEIEEGVTVIIADRRQRFVDRTVKTDALGRFAVALPEGDWTVKVTMPSGRVYAVGKGEVTASAGHVWDEAGNEIGQLTIRR